MSVETIEKTIETPKENTKELGRLPDKVVDLDMSNGEITPIVELQDPVADDKDKIPTDLADPNYFNDRKRVRSEYQQHFPGEIKVEKYYDPDAATGDRVVVQRYGYPNPTIYIVYGDSMIKDGALKPELEHAEFSFIPRDPGERVSYSSTKLKKTPGGPNLPILRLEETIQSNDGKPVRVLRQYALDPEKIHRSVDMDERMIKERQRRLDLALEKSRRKAEETKRQEAEREILEKERQEGLRLPMPIVNAVTGEPLHSISIPANKKRDKFRPSPIERIDDETVQPGAIGLTKVESRTYDDSLKEEPYIHIAPRTIIDGEIHLIPKYDPATIPADLRDEYPEGEDLIRVTEKRKMPGTNMTYTYERFYSLKDLPQELSPNNLAKLRQELEEQKKGQSGTPEKQRRTNESPSSDGNTIRPEIDDITASPTQTERGERANIRLVTKLVEGTKDRLTVYAERAKRNKKAFLLAPLFVMSAGAAHDIQPLHPSDIARLHEPQPIHGEFRSKTPDEAGRPTVDMAHDRPDLPTANRGTGEQEDHRHEARPAKPRENGPTPIDHGAQVENGGQEVQNMTSMKPIEIGADGLWGVVGAELKQYLEEHKIQLDPARFEALQNALMRAQEQNYPRVNWHNVNGMKIQPLTEEEMTRFMDLYNSPATTEAFKRVKDNLTAMLHGNNANDKIVWEYIKTGKLPVTEGLQKAYRPSTTPNRFERRSRSFR